MKSLPALALTSLISISLSLISPTSCLAAVAPADLDALKQLFRGEGHFAKDPAAAFEKSWKMFQEPRNKAGTPAGESEGMEVAIRQEQGTLHVIPTRFSPIRLTSWRQVL